MTYKKIILLIFSIILTICSPLIGSLIKWNGNIPGYGDFPAKQVLEPPGFSPVAFGFGLIIVLFILAFLIFPQFFGFRKIHDFQSEKNIKKASFPIWFSLGIIIFFLSLLISWSIIPISKLTPYMFVSLWWSVIMILDGIIYKRSGGKSLIANKLTTVLLLAVVSSVGWFIFEYLNFFILENWYYPNNKVFTVYGNYVWYLASYTIIFPQVFEIYNLFETIPSIKNKYAFGPKINFSRKTIIGLLMGGIFLSFLMGLFPYELFFTVWINPVLIMATILALVGVTTPFSSIKDGNWSKILLVGIAMVVCGLMWEFVNYGNQVFGETKSLNPSYWKYAVPYVNEIKFPFSEMPILGYFGYIPYGWVCWLQWVIFTKFLKVDETVCLEDGDIIYEDFLYERPVI